ncbi:MAG: MerR family transcriptional regulator [Candidatus Melainabacteria bacterium]|nr:MerR family transcriptional regulator [Candidatus Melainabacteria bacterium]
MSRNAKVEGTKIAQAAKDLNVTSVTIRRYITEFNIETTSDENGIKVLPDMAMEELQKIRELKEEGLTNPQVLEKLEEMRSSDRKPAKAKAKAKAATKAKPEPEIEAEEEEKPAARVKEKEKETKRPVKRVTKVKEAPPEDKDEEDEVSEEEKADTEGDADGSQGESESGEGKPKHSLTCQTCGKVFEHMNPRLRDCLDCYRAKRKERRRGGAERHKNVIQHPLAQQAASRQAQQTSANGATEQERFTEEAPKRAPQRDRERDRDRGDRDRSDRTEREPAAAVSQAYIAAPAAQSQVVAQGLQRTVRNYRKAIEETRNITGSLKRRLERPDLPEGERRWLEQIYAYQLILHQGWRHLAEYKAATQQQGKGPGSSSPSPLAIDD